MQEKPYKVARDGTVTDRAAGHIIGYVRREAGVGWSAETLSTRVPPGTYPDGRKYAARAVWQQYEREVGRR